MITAADLPLLIISGNSSSERRVTPSWSISHLKDRLEPITGIPASCQRLSLKVTSSQAAQPIEAQDEDATQLANWLLQTYAEIHVGAGVVSYIMSHLQTVVHRTMLHDTARNLVHAQAVHALHVMARRITLTIRERPASY